MAGVAAGFKGEDKRREACVGKLRAHPDADAVQQRRLFREAGGVNLGALIKTRQQTGRAGPVKAKNGDRLRAEEILPTCKPTYCSNSHRCFDGLSRQSPMAECRPTQS